MEKRAGTGDRERGRSAKYFSYPVSFVMLIGVLLTFISFGCYSQKSITVKQIEYFASTRGSSIQILVNVDHIIYNDTIFKITPKKWNSLTSLVQKINIDKLNNLQAPTEDRFRDAALAAEIKITTFDTTYTSSQFDHGNPPKEIKKLVQELLNLVEM